MSETGTETTSKIVWFELSGPGVGRYAHCTDTEGKRFGLFQAVGGEA